MSVLVPPRRWRLRFWLLGLRLPVEYRPWVAAQVMTPGYDRRRLRTTLGFLLVCYVIPQVGLALASHSRFRLAIPLLVLGCWLVLAMRNSRMTPATRARVLAYHGVTADGGLVEPLSVWGGNPLGHLGLALLCAQVLLFSSGVAIAADRIIARRACHPVAADVLTELSGDIGVPSPGRGAFSPVRGFPHDPPIAGVVPGSSILFARQVATPFEGIHYLAGYVRSDSGALIGPGVWRVVEPNTTFSLPTRQISGLEPTARVLTPSLGFSFGGPPDELVGEAKNCARAAR